MAGGRAEDFYAKLAENLPKMHLPESRLIEHRGVQKLLRLEVGNVFETNEPLVWMLNSADNAHAAIVGTTGSGKTHLVKTCWFRSLNKRREVAICVFDTPVVTWRVMPTL